MKGYKLSTDGETWQELKGSNTILRAWKSETSYVSGVSVSGVLGETEVQLTHNGRHYLASFCRFLDYTYFVIRHQLMDLNDLKEWTPKHYRRCQTEIENRYKLAKARRIIYEARKG